MEAGDHTQCAMIAHGQILITMDDIKANIIKIKELRRDIDVQTQKVKSLPQSREQGIVVLKLQEATMWLGMELKRINEAYPGLSPNPYPNSKDPSNIKIEPTADGLKM